MSDGEKVSGIPLPKLCKYCNRTKHSYEFSKFKLSPDGLQYRCKQCIRDYRRENVDRLKALSKIARQERLKKDPDHDKKRYAEMMDDYKRNMAVDQNVIKRLGERLASEVKVCKGCGQDLPLSKYHVRIRLGTQISIRTLCKQCHNKKSSDNASGKQQSPKSKLTRYRRSAARYGYEFDLTLEFVTEILSKPCAYCGSEIDKKTIDRKDSSKGYTKANSEVSCLRCNLTKSDMPYEAWLVVAEGMRKAREMDLFGDWTGRRSFIDSKKIDSSIETVPI